ncbi:15231_t:CDS:2, partial [Dentiscutata erythropus]
MLTKLHSQDNFEEHELPLQYHKELYQDNSYQDELYQDNSYQNKLQNESCPNESSSQVKPSTCNKALTNEG